MDGKFHADGIPEQLRATPQWIVWKLTDRNGKPDKPPCDYRTGLPGDVKDPSVWMPFPVAIQEARRFDGVGFAFTPRDEFAGVDLDHCIDDEGHLEPWAEGIVDWLASYTELSPSGRGLHIYVRGRLPDAGRRRIGGFGPGGSGGIEMYDRARYFTVTGNHWEGSPRTVENRGEELLALHRSIFKDEPARLGGDAVPPSPHDLTDEAILDRARAAWNGSKFKALFDRGELSAHQGDHSRADLALCCHLAFWSGGAIETIDRLFRGSALYRPKWDEMRGPQTYGQRTIARALEGMRAFYDPKARTATATAGREPGSDDSAGEGDGQPFNRTDLGNARRLVAQHGGALRYCHPWGKWLAWAGDRWQVDETGLVHRFANSVVARLHAEASAQVDEAARKVLSTWALACESEKRLNSMVSLARRLPGIPILPGELDAWPWLLNCPNGTLDLRTGKLGPHVRDDHLTLRTGTPFDPDAACPAWDAFLLRVMGGDEDLIGFLRRAVGYGLTGDVSEHAIFFLYGKGRNGKSTFLGAIQHASGDYAITVNADLLISKSQDDHPTGVADLQGRRFVATIEVEDGRRLAESLVKSLTGGDRIRARRMRQDFYEFDPTHKLFLAANHKPTVRGTDEGIWRRIKLVPFAVQIPPEEVDRNLPAKLRAEAPGILAWAVRGCLEWQAGGLREPAAVAEATAGYRAEMDVLADFLAERCILIDGARCKASDLYRAYVDWCKETGTQALSMRRFGLVLTDRGIRPDKSGSVNWRLGVGLREEKRPESVPNSF